MVRSSVRWALKHRLGNKSSAYIVYEGLLPKLFRTRAEARAYNTKRFGYIKSRKDLRVAPFFWRMPVPIRVVVSEVI